MKRRSPAAMERRARAFLDEMLSRRSVRFFSSKSVPKRLIELAVRTAGSAPSGANRQPWKFVAVCDPLLKREIREGAEREERNFYHHLAPQEWLRALKPIGTDWRKPFLEVAPWVVVVFAELHGVDSAGAKVKNYYVQESVGMACGLFVAALQRMGLATLTHTPSPMKFLNGILQRPERERPYVLFPIGYPASHAKVPDLKRKALEQILVWDSQIQSADE